MTKFRTEFADVTIRGHELDGLYMPRIPMTALTLGDALIIHSSGESDGETSLVAEVEEPGQRVSLYREDGKGLLVYDAESGISEAYRDALATPIDSLQLTKEYGLWQAHLEENVVRNRVSMIGFISLVAMYAEIKQFKIQQGRA